ncbi:LOW QUALITY PROTEIN: very long chain fatty acid elongase 7 [Lepeophtheirus salmonis]|uniref:Elongation of very long chain fatty acids protein n=1 Tax=Lepeophtheirus salmonis TaxID=72036 RepID=A0A0K2UF48_LEPSM|nr:LOW QUALITY PROTEIN: elongation of very long chain fatty acids protein-like [Lepeophtheirus salmonis]
MEVIRNLSREYDRVWEKRDTRVDGWFLMSSPIPTLLICTIYVYIVKVAGPKFMEKREPFQIRGFLILYNLAQVIFSTYIFIEILLAGWLFEYSFRCQPVDYSNNPSAVRMAAVAWLYFFSKFTEFFDTFCFVLRKKFSHISLLHVVHHGIMPMSVWPGARFVPGGHATFFGLCNSFIHIFMYLYYFFTAMGPKYQKYCWWKQHMTTMQMIQFVLIMVHGFQLIFYDDCLFPYQFSYYIGAHAILFFILFLDFYIKAYINKNTKKAKIQSNNGTAIMDKKME